jgi:radical SAM protein (TIGR01212 family)
MTGKAMENSSTRWDGKRFHSLDYALKEKFGKKIAKLALYAGMTCPTRDGTKGNRGCLFCSRRGSGDFTKPGSITCQMKQQSEELLGKWDNCAFIAYFQSYTNTYAPVEKLRNLFDEALTFPGTVGLAVATRCDCLSDEVLSLLAEYNEKTFLWVELGLQSACDVTGRLIRRGFATEEFDRAVIRLNKLKILSVVHLIAGLPGEDRKKFLESVKHINQLPLWGIKIHMLHVLNDSDLYDEYQKRPFELPDMEDYAETVCDALEILRSDIVVHRLTGDGNKENLIAPLWTLNKRRVLTEINQELQRRKTFQGRHYKE